MTTCGSCGRQIGEDFAFCPYCGAPVPATVPAREQRKRVTILFCDVTGSTALGESSDPEALRALLARYFERMKGIIESHGGTVEKFIGDAVMAVFGVPQLHEDDALRSCRAAIEMRAALPELGLVARIGIQTGEVVTGTAERLATGDAVNVAARLQTAAPAGEVLIGEETLGLVKDAVEIVPVSPLALKGKRELVPAFRLCAVREVGERPELAPMIGRQRELRRLEDTFTQMAHDRSCQLFTILGAPGVGKSRLSREFLRSLGTVRTVRGRCLPYGDGITYWPVVEVLTLLDALPSDAYAASTLKSLLGETKTVASGEEIAWAFRKLLEEQAQDGPLIVLFDDIQWGEERFLDLIEHISDLSRDAPILLLCMARPELLEKRPAWGGGKWNATTVLLEPLDAGETDRLLDALGGVELELRERITQAAEGNPLFVEEMLALIRDAGGSAVVVPPSIQALLAARLDQLAPEERRVRECGSIEGRTFHQSAVGALLESETDLRERLTAVVRKELVRPAPSQISSDEAYRFRHLLVRDAAYDALPKAARAALHERFAGWLEERGEHLLELDEILGYHLEQAAKYRQVLGQPDGKLVERASERLAAAGRRALWRGDPQAARRLLERALALLRPFRLDVSLELDLAEAEPTVQEASAIADAAARRARAENDRCGEAVATVVAAEYRSAFSSAGLVNDMEALAREALPLLEETEDHEGLVHVWIALSEVANFYGRSEERAHAAEQAIFHARRIGRPGLFHLPLALIYGPRPADEALRTLEPLLLEEPHPLPRLELAMLLAMLGRFEEAWAVGQEASQRWRELIGGGEYGAGPLSAIATLAGDHQAASGYLRALCDWLEERGDRGRLSTFAPELGHSLCMLGRYDEAEPLALLGRELGDSEDVITQLRWRQVLALVYSHRTQKEEAEQLAREAVRIAEQTDGLSYQGDALCDLAEVLEHAGRRDEAIDALHQALDRYHRKKNLAMVAQVRERLDHMRAANNLGSVKYPAS